MNVIVELKSLWKSWSFVYRMEVLSFRVYHRTSYKSPYFPFFYDTVVYIYNNGEQVHPELRVR